MSNESILQGNKKFIIHFTASARNHGRLKCQVWACLKYFPLFCHFANFFFLYHCYLQEAALQVFKYLYTLVDDSSAEIVSSLQADFDAAHWELELKAMFGIIEQVQIWLAK